MVSRLTASASMMSFVRLSSGHISRALGRTQERASLAPLGQAALPLLKARQGHQAALSNCLPDHVRAAQDQHVRGKGIFQGMVRVRTQNGGSFQVFLDDQQLRGRLIPRPKEDTDGGSQDQADRRSECDALPPSARGLDRPAGFLANRLPCRRSPARSNHLNFLRGTVLEKRGFSWGCFKYPSPRRPARLPGYSPSGRRPLCSRAHRAPTKVLPLSAGLDVLDDAVPHRKPDPAHLPDSAQRPARQHSVKDRFAAVGCPFFKCCWSH